MTHTNNKDKRSIILLNLLIRQSPLAALAGSYVTQLDSILVVLSHLSYVDKPLLDYNETREYKRRDLLRKLTSSDQICQSILRLSKTAFVNLCELLRDLNLVKDTRNSSAEEKITKFLYLVSHNVKNRELCFFFHRSPRSISRHFHEVLRAVISLHDRFIKQPDGTEDAPEIYNTTRFYPYFKNCLGAIDGTHIRVRVPGKDAARYRGRKDWPTTNVLASCSFDMKFTYVLPGWEGTTSDSRILKDALNRSDNLNIPEGKFYLGDAGFGIKSYLITPYRGVRYHLKEYSKHAPVNAKELFNHRHASARNVIERAFGVLKKRFSIIASETEPSYPIKTHIGIILACCVLHNYLMGVDPIEDIIDEVDRELANATIQDTPSMERVDEDVRKEVLLRDEICSAMWNDYVL